MRARFGTFVLPAYLLLCLMLGGSVRSVWPNMVVQLGAVALILCAVFTRPTEPTPRAAHWLMLIACAALALFAIQMIPLPSSVWSSFLGRDVLVRGFTLLKEPAPSLPLSLAPYATLSASLALLPPIAVFAAAIRLPQDERLLLAAIIVGAVANVILAALQITSEGRSSVFLLYLYYRFDNRPAWFRAIWWATDVGRRGISKLPFPARKAVTTAIAAAVYYPLARSARLLERSDRNVSNIPLSAYRHNSFYTMRTDALDRFGTRLEHRFTKQEMRQLMEAAGLERIVFREGEPYWVACGYRAGT